MSKRVSAQPPGEWAVLHGDEEVEGMKLAREEERDYASNTPSTAEQGQNHRGSSPVRCADTDSGEMKGQIMSLKNQIQSLKSNLVAASKANTKLLGKEKMLRGLLEEAACKYGIFSRIFPTIM
jgi:hypothetical protein